MQSKQIFLLRVSPNWKKQNLQFIRFHFLWCCKVTFYGESVPVFNKSQLWMHRPTCAKRQTKQVNFKFKRKTDWVSAASQTERLILVEWTFRRGTKNWTIRPAQSQRLRAGHRAGKLEQMSKERKTLNLTIHLISSAAKTCCNTFSLWTGQTPPPPPPRGQRPSRHHEADARGSPLELLSDGPDGVSIYARYMHSVLSKYTFTFHFHRKLGLGNATT